MIKRALISVYDKTGITELAHALHEQGIHLMSTGGTARLLSDAGIPVQEVAEATKFPECLDGRVKTLHPVIHGGLLARRPDPEHMNTLKQLSIEPIDLLVINLYPFKDTMLRKDASFEEVIEQIDIGGPAMLRSAAKNHESVTVMTDPGDYDKVLEEIKASGDTKMSTRRQLAAKVFRLTSHYDTLIASYLGKNADVELFPKLLTITFEKSQDLRYGENPHQKGSFYKDAIPMPGTLASAKQIQGKALSFNNINDAAGTLALLQEFDAPTVVAVKHTNPCGVASADTVEEAYERAFEADPQSIFGGIVAANRPISGEMAKRMSAIFLEVIMAPAFTEEALTILAAKPNIRLLEIPSLSEPDGNSFELKHVAGGLLIQEVDSVLSEPYALKTETDVNDKVREDLDFAWKVVKHVKSNAIVIAKDKQTIAIGPGQTSRIWALQNALRNTLHPTKDAVMASDAFFPFADCVDEAAKAGIKAIIQPGGSQKDQDSIDACNRHGIAMIFTGMRHFKH